MNAPLFLPPPDYYLIIQGIPRTIIRVWMLSLFAFSGQAQTNYAASQGRSVHLRYLPESAYDLNTGVIQRQLISLVEHLGYLSVVDPTAYALLLGDFDVCLYQLQQQRATYSNKETSLQLRLLRLDDQIKVALVERRRLSHEEGPTHIILNRLPQGQPVAVRTYTFLFDKPSHQSRLRGIIAPRETVTILKDGDIYCKVKYGLLKGYISRGMIVNNPKGTRE